jgi:hypothetical protein
LDHLPYPRDRIPQHMIEQTRLLKMPDDLAICDIFQDRAKRTNSPASTRDRKCAGISKGMAP